MRFNNCMVPLDRKHLWTCFRII